MSYYETLNISPSASRSEIKSAYRRLAKLYHPDVSDDPQAREKFIAITEAYEALVEDNFHYTPSNTDYSWQENTVSEEDLRKQRAREYAKMQYEEFIRNNTAFKNSWYYQPARLFIRISVGMAYALATLFMLSIIFWIIGLGLVGLFPGIIFFMIGFGFFLFANGMRDESERYFKDY